MHIKVEFLLEVVRAELAKVRLVPHDDGRVPNFVEARPARKEGVNDRRYVLAVLHNEFALRRRKAGQARWRGLRQKIRTMLVAGGGGPRWTRPLPMRGRVALNLA